MQDKIKFKTIIREIMRGKSLSRAMLNNMLQGLKVSGECIDLGAKSGKASHYRFIDASEATMRYCDIVPGENVEVIDLEGPLPFPDRAFSNALLVHVLEHIYNTDILVSEMQRVADRSVVVVPFYFNYHTDPQDYVRYSHTGLKRKFEEAGFSEVTVYPLIFGPLFAALVPIWPLMRFNALRALVTTLLWLPDRWLRRRLPYYMSYVVIASNAPSDATSEAGAAADASSSGLKPVPA